MLGSAYLGSTLVGTWSGGWGQQRERQVHTVLRYLLAVQSDNGLSLRNDSMKCPPRAAYPPCVDTYPLLRFDQHSLLPHSHCPLLRRPLQDQSPDLALGEQDRCTQGRGEEASREGRGLREGRGGRRRGSVACLSLLTLHLKHCGDGSVFSNGNSSFFFFHLLC